LGRAGQGLELSKKSWRLFIGNRQLTLFAFLGGLFGLLAAAALILPGAYVLKNVAFVPGVMIVWAGFFLGISVAMYFNVALVATADKLMRGEEASLRSGLEAASGRLTQILEWSALSASVNVLLGLLRSEGGSLGKLLGAAGGIAWNLVTFLVVPVIAFEGLTPKDAFKRSTGLFKQRWGEQVTGEIIVGSIGVISLLGVMAVVWGGIMYLGENDFGPARLGIPMMLGGVVAIVASITIGEALRGIFSVALYRFAIDGHAVGNFTESELRDSIQKK
jgi:hypothetical protein